MKVSTYELRAKISAVAGAIKFLKDLHPAFEHHCDYILRQLDFMMDELNNGKK